MKPEVVAPPPAIQTVSGTDGIGRAAVQNLCRVGAGFVGEDTAAVALNAEGCGRRARIAIDNAGMMGFVSPTVRRRAHLCEVGFRQPRRRLDRRHTTSWAGSSGGRACAF